MDDFLDVLYNYLTEERLPRAPLPWGYGAQRSRREKAYQALSATFSPEQRELYLRFEDAVNGLSNLETRQVFRETVFLARELFR